MACFNKSIIPQVLCTTEGHLCFLNPPRCSEKSIVCSILNPPRFSEKIDQSYIGTSRKIDQSCIRLKSRSKMHMESILIGWIQKNHTWVLHFLASFRFNFLYVTVRTKSHLLKTRPNIQLSSGWTCRSYTWKYPLKRNSFWHKVVNNYCHQLKRHWI